MGKVLFIFLDGLGLGPPGEENPLSQHAWEGLRAAFGARPILGEEARGEERLLLPLDSTLGVPGLPQSATGQVALFCGVNAAALLGYHLAGYPNAKLRQVIDCNNILKRAAAAGKRVTFANAYTPQYFRLAAEGRIRHSVTTECVLSAGLRFRLLSDLLAGQAVYWDITNEILRQRPGYEHVPLVDPAVAGQRLAALLQEHDLVLFECFRPDRIGHERDRAAALRFLPQLERFLLAALEHLPQGATLVVSSDHGNIEDLSTGAHTENPVPLLCAGPGTPHFRTARAVTDLASAILACLGGVAHQGGVLERHTCSQGGWEP